MVDHLRVRVEFLIVELDDQVRDDLNYAFVGALLRHLYWLLLNFILLVFLHGNELTILGDLRAKQHLANSFNGDLSEVFVRDEEVMLKDKFLESLSLLAGAIEYKAVE